MPTQTITNGVWGGETLGLTRNFDKLKASTAGGFVLSTQDLDWSVALDELFNLGTALSYFSIPFALTKLLRKYTTSLDVVFRLLLTLFAGFILACGTGHLVHHVLIPWFPNLSGLKTFAFLIDGVTAFVSILTAWRLPKLIKNAEQFVLEKIETDRRLKESEARFDAFMSCPRIAAWIKDETFKNIWFNQTLTKVYGTIGLNQRDDEWLPSTASDTTIGNDRKVLETGQPHEAIEAVPAPSGEKRVWISYKFLLTTSEGRYVAGIAYEITEKERLREALERTNKALENTNEELRNFVYIASHDLKSPTRSILAFAEKLQEGASTKLSERQNRQLGHIITAAKWMQQMVDDLLVYSRVSREQIQLEPILLLGTIQTALANLNAQIREVRPELKVNVPGNAYVLGDNHQISQVVQNLVGNALKFVSEDRRPLIEIEAVQREGFWYLSVSDNGIGIESQFLGKIFKLFERLHSREEYEGTGLGLAICQRIVERHGGCIWVNSIPGQGSKFIFSLQATHDHPSH